MGSLGPQAVGTVVFLCLGSAPLVNEAGLVAKAGFLGGQGQDFPTGGWNWVLAHPWVGLPLDTDPEAAVVLGRL